MSGLGCRKALVGYWEDLFGINGLKKQAISPQWASIFSIQGCFSAMPRVAFPKRLD